MSTITYDNWKEHVVSPEKIMDKIEPGMSVFIGTGVSEPRTLVKHMMKSDSPNLQDLELIQLISLGDAISMEQLRSNKFRLKTFYSGWVANEAITAGRVDLIPSRFSRIPYLIENRHIPIDVAIIQVTPPNEAGYCSLGLSVDTARQAMEQAKIVIGEINTQIPMTHGDTFIPLTEFDMFVTSDEKPICYDRWQINNVFDPLAAQVASIIDDGSCLAFTIGPLFEALPKHLAQKRHLGIHTPMVTDAVMDLVKSGAVTNRYKDTYRGKCLTSYAVGSKDLYTWLHRNPLVEFQGVDKVFNPILIGRNSRFVAVIHTSKVDLSGRVTLHAGKSNIATIGPSEVIDFYNGAEISRGGYAIFALPSRNAKGEPNIVLTLADKINQFNAHESILLVVTEYGVANFNGKTVRERAQALIDIAHPEDRLQLVKAAKAAKILYQDQIFLENSAHLYPESVYEEATFKKDLKVRFRAIKPSDEEEMRRLFYRFSDEAIYYRYFTSIKTMPHAKMQEYVNIDYSKVMSIVGLIGERGEGHIIAEARFVINPHNKYADVAFVVDEQYQSMGIATFIYLKLIKLAKEMGIQGFTADVLSSNKEMMRVFEKGGMLVKAKLQYGTYELQIPFKSEVEGTNGGKL